MRSVEDKQRLFVALWPPSEIAEAIASSRIGVVGDGRPVATDRLHVTLQFLGDVPASRLADINAALDCIAQPAFELCLDRFGYWQRTRVVWLGSACRCEPLDELVSALAAELGALGFKPERRPFRGHLTLARNCRMPGDLRPPRPLHWVVRSCSLVASTLTQRGALYRQLHTCPLS